MDQNEGKWPTSAFHFEVEFDNEEGIISFQEVSGLDQEAQVIEYRHGDSQLFTTIKKAGLIKTSNLSLKKGVFDEDDRLIEMFQKLYEKEYYGGEDPPLNILIKLLDETGEVVMSWNCQRCVPIKLTAPTMKSDSNEVAIESIEFAYEQITAEAGDQ